MDSTTLSPDQNRRIESLIRIGVIAAVDHANARAQARSGGLLTDWLPWLERRAFETRDWDPPDVGEQCLILSPSGGTEAGVLLTGLYLASPPPPSNEPSKVVREWKDGARFHYDDVAHEYRVSVPDGGKIVLTIGKTTLELRGDGVTLSTPDFEGVQT